MAAHLAPPSLGFSRQEHWSGLPFPSPMCESEKWKWSRSVVSDPQWPHGLQPSRLLCPWDFPGKSTGVGCHCLLRQNTMPCLINHALVIPCKVRADGPILQMSHSKTHTCWSRLGLGLQLGLFLFRILRDPEGGKELRWAEKMGEF